MLPATSGARLLADATILHNQSVLGLPLFYSEHVLCPPSGLVRQPNKQIQSLVLMPLAHLQFYCSPEAVVLSDQLCAELRLSIDAVWSNSCELTQSTHSVFCLPEIGKCAPLTAPLLAC